MRFPHGPGFGFGFYTVFTDILAGLVFLICLVVVVGLIVLLVRFLLVATKAAELYIATNRPATENEATTNTEPVVTAPPTGTTPRSRTPKTPPV